MATQESLSDTPSLRLYCLPQMTPFDDEAERLARGLLHSAHKFSRRYYSRRSDNTPSTCPLCLCRCIESDPAHDSVLSGGGVYICENCHTWCHRNISMLTACTCLACGFIITGGFMYTPDPEQPSITELLCATCYRIRLGSDHKAKLFYEPGEFKEKGRVSDH